MSRSLKSKKRLGNCSKLKDTKDTYQQNTMHDSEVNYFAMGWCNDDWLDVQGSKD